MWANASVGTASSISALVTFTYQNGVYTTLYSTPDSNNIFWATGINDSGVVVGDYDVFDIYNIYAGVLDQGAIVTLNSFYTNNPSPYYFPQFAYVTGINDFGEILGSDENGLIILAPPAREPGTFALLAVGLLPILARLRRILSEREVRALPLVSSQ